MKRPDGYEPRPECAGAHVFYPHDHRHVPAEHAWQRCSGRFRCAACDRWFAGEVCDPATMGAQLPHDQEAPLLVGADLA